jgi:hypothetical protein
LNQKIIETDIYIKLIEYDKRKTNTIAQLHILEILSTNKYFLFLKIKFIYIKWKKYIQINITTLKIKYTQNN